MRNKKKLEDCARHTLTHQELEENLHLFDTNGALLLTWYFGLKNHDERSMEEITEHFDRHPQTINEQVKNLIRLLGMYLFAIEPIKSSGYRGLCETKTFHSDTEKALELLENFQVTLETIHQFLPILDENDKILLSRKFGIFSPIQNYADIARAFTMSQPSIKKRVESVLRRISKLSNAREDISKISTEEFYGTPQTTFRRIY